MKKPISIILSLTIALGMMAGCSQKEAKKEEAKEIVNPDKPISVATMTDTEGGVLGKMVVLALKENGFKVEDKTNTLGSTKLVREVAVKKQADITINYTGNGMYIMGADGEPEWKDLEKGYEKIKEFDKKENNLDWLRPAKANNTELLAVTKEFADKNKIVDMNDFARYVNEGGEIKIATPAYWLQHDSGLIGLEKAYGFKIKEEQLVIGEKAEKQVASGTADINCTMVFTTDGILDELGLYVIKDPKKVPPVYAPTPIVNGETLEKYPQIEEILNPIFESLETEGLSKLNGKVLSQGANPEDVASEYLKSKGFIK